MLDFSWRNATINPLKDLIYFLSQKGKAESVLKKSLVIELRNNLNVFRNGFINNTPYDNIIDLLDKTAAAKALENPRDSGIKKIMHEKIGLYHVQDERNLKYIGWSGQKLLDKIEEKTSELKNLKEMFGGTVKDAKANNVALMLSNLYFRYKLFAEFIRAENIEPENIRAWPERGLEVITAGLITDSLNQVKKLQAVMIANRIEPQVLNAFSPNIEEQIALCPFIIFLITGKPKEIVFQLLDVCKSLKKPPVILVDSSEEFAWPAKYSFININIQNQGFLNFVLQKPFNDIRKSITSSLN